MIKQNINQEKFTLLISGIVDGGTFNKRIAKIRAEVGIPANGFKTSAESKKWHSEYLEEMDREFKKKKINTKNRVFKYNEEIENIIKDNPDLGVNFRNAIRYYIMFGKKAMIGVGSYAVFSRNENGKKIYGMEFYNRLSKKEFADAVATMELFNKRLPKISSSKDLDLDIKILKLSKKKGTKVVSDSSKYLELDENSPFSDENIILEVISEEKDTIENRQKNMAFVRQRRSRLDKKIKNLFPNTPEK